MSFGFVDRRAGRPAHGSRPPFQEPFPAVISDTVAPSKPPLPSSPKCRLYDVLIIVLLLCQSAFDFFGFAWTGLVLKWPIVYGPMSHSHPHTPQEDYISRPNNYLNIIMAAFAIDLFEPLWLLVMYCRNKARKRPPTSCTYSCCTSIFFLYSFICLLLVGALCSTCIAVIMSAKPPNMQPCNSSLVFHETIFELGDMIVLFVTVFFVGIIKLASYWLGVPQMLLLWKFPAFYKHLST